MSLVYRIMHEFQKLYENSSIEYNNHFSYMMPASRYL